MNWATSKFSLTINAPFCEKCHPEEHRQHKLRKLIFILANPIIDITEEVAKTFLEKYNLKPNSACVYTEEQKGLFEELDALRPHQQIGGSTLNTGRIVQWLLKVPECVVLFGAVGSDASSVLLEESLSKEGVSFIFKHVEECPTARCAVLITDHNRSLCTDLGASRMLDIRDLLVANTWEAVVDANYYYVSAFFLGVSEEIVFTLAQHSLEFNKTFILNIGASFLTKKYKNQFISLLEFVDIVLGNEEEIIALANSFTGEQKSSIEDSIHIIKNWKQSKSKKNERIVIVTRGPNNVMACEKSKEIVEFPVPKIKNIKDTNAAGDAFAGGFISQYVQGSKLNICIDCGIWAATQIIQDVGCTFNSVSNYKEGWRS